MDITLKFITPVIAFLLTLVFGFWLGRSGKPYNGVLFNIHKLIALGAVILITMQIYNALKIMEINTLIVIMIVIAAICAIALFASGAFMSIGNHNYQIMKFIHNVAPILLVIAMAFTIYLLFWRKL